MTEKRIHVDYMARVEGEASLNVRVVDGEIKELVLDVFEPPRFFQGFLVGRSYEEVPEIVSRICGICPVSHQLAAIQAIEDAFGIEPSEQTKDLRRLLALSQWIQSHTLHVYFLAAPDFLGYESVLAMAEDYGPVVERALKLKRLGNDLTALIGGREVHPVTAVIKGFTSLPDEGELLAIRERLEEARKDAQATVTLAASLEVPDFERPCEHIAVRSSEEYAIYDGRVVSTEGLDIAAWDYRNHIRERHVPPAHALHSYVVGRGSFLVGPLARVNLNREQLSDNAKAALEKVRKAKGVEFPSFNPFHGAIARAVELVHAVDECIKIIDRLELVEEPISYQIKAGEGFAVTEAPRGLLYHSYRINDQGIIEEADIVSPTAHNVYNMEEDLRAFIPTVLDLPDDEATLKCETVIRNYDPCFSCSAHFLKMRIERE